MMTAQPKGRRLAKRNLRPIVLACAAIVLALVLGLTVSALTLHYVYNAIMTDPLQAAVSTPTPAPSPTPTAPAETPEPVRHRDDIVSEGRLLAYDLQEIMQDRCEVYGVPYALALAIAEVETHFDPDAVSPTHDYGLMQINQVNHEWLQGLGMDPLTHAGNIEAGLYIIGGYLDTYGDTEMALMAYNNGPGGARKLWDAGTYQTDYLCSYTYGSRPAFTLPCQRHFKMSIFAEMGCRFLQGSIQVLYSLIHHITCRFEARQALIYQLASGLMGENGKYNYSKAVHLYPPFFDIFCSPKNYKTASALTPLLPLCQR